jgi:hypothetical protein
VSLVIPGGRVSGTSGRDAGSRWYRDRLNFAFPRERFSARHHTGILICSVTLNGCAVGGLRHPLALLDSIKECHYLSDPGQVELLLGVGEGLRQLQEMGLGLVLLTNQSGINRGYFGWEEVERVHHVLRELLGAEGVAVPVIAEQVGSR